MKVEQKVAEKETEWWVTHIPDTVTECGPYTTHREADDAKRGLKKFFAMIEKDIRKL